MTSTPRNSRGDRSDVSLDEERDIPTAKDAIPATSVPKEAGVEIHEPFGELLRDGRHAARYISKRTLGSGGMGEVFLCHDRLVGRDIALKVLRGVRSNDPTAVHRFLREARVQGQLEHPSIVPVYELGITPDGRTYFAMKRVRGNTLAEIVSGLRHGREDFVAAYSRRKLLTSFASVCLAVELAHQRGVVHRDLKPSNIMLGDFGEVYVLDWGIAGITERDDTPGSETIHEMPSSDTHLTVAGNVLGTPGYMSPEQARGDVSALDARSDVYALGAILFELLTLQSLHAKSSAAEALASTLNGVEARPSVRAPDRDVPPELDALCAKATALDAKDRFASARELASAIERYLDGDRDLERRRELAATHATSAAELANLVVAAPDRVEMRRRALAEVGQALGLDPSNAEARRTLVQLLTTPPNELPPAAASTMEMEEMAAQRLSARIGVISYACWLLTTPLLLWMGIESWPLFIIYVAAHVAAFGALLWADRAPTVGGPPLYAATIASLVATATVTLGFGPLVLLPTVASATMTAMLLHPRQSARVAIAATCCAMVLFPSALEALSVISPSYHFEGGIMSITPRMVRFTAAPALIALMFASLGTLAASAAAVAGIRRALTQAEERLHLQAWQLRQLVP